MSTVAVFVLSDVRSGSTLLDQCLGAHNRIVSLGEVHWLAAYIREDRSLYDPNHPLVCSCGVRVPDCPFWLSVADRVGRPLELLCLRSVERPPRSVRRSEPRAGRVLKRLIRNMSALTGFSNARAPTDANALAKDLISLYDAVASVTGCDFCVDSSKSPLRFRTLYDFEPMRAMAIILTRDYRAVVHSRMKRGQTLEAAALGWKRKMREIDSMTRDLPSKSVCRLKYESFCENPRAELHRVCEFMGVQFSDEMLSRPKSGIHHIGGSPSKFDASLTSIALDRSYENQLSQDECDQLHRIVGADAGKWGY